MFIDISDLMEEWETTITVLKKEGQYKGGRWDSEAETEEETLAVVVPLSNDDLQYDENGTYTKQDIKVYIRYPIASNAEITYKGKKYKVQEQGDYSEYSNVYIYFAKRLDSGGDWHETKGD